MFYRQYGVAIAFLKMNTNITANQIHMLHVLYREVLGRDADETGIAAYCPILRQRHNKSKKLYTLQMNIKLIKLKKHKNKQLIKTNQKLWTV